jgi:hypothetical protein
VITTKSYSPEVHAACERAGARVRDVQRMTLEEIFVANVMSTRREHDSGASNNRPLLEDVRS